MYFRLIPGYVMVNVGDDGHPNSWEMWHGDAYLHTVEFRASSKKELMAEAVMRNLIQEIKK